MASSSPLPDVHGRVIEYYKELLDVLAGVILANGYLAGGGHLYSGLCQVGHETDFRKLFRAFFHDNLFQLALYKEREVR